MRNKRIETLPVFRVDISETNTMARRLGTIIRPYDLPFCVDPAKARKEKGAGQKISFCEMPVRLDHHTCCTDIVRRAEERLFGRIALDRDADEDPIVMSLGYGKKFGHFFGQRAGMEWSCDIRIGAAALSAYYASGIVAAGHND